MDNPWRFGWEAVGAIAGILSLIGFLVVEWPKIGSTMLIKGILPFLIFGLVGLSIGFLLANSLLAWRLLSLGLGIASGAFFGAAFQDEEVHRGRLTLLAVGVIISVIVGLWVATHLNPPLVG